MGLTHAIFTVSEILKLGKDSDILWQLQKALLLLKISIQLEGIRFSETVKHKNHCTFTHKNLLITIFYFVFYLALQQDCVLWQGGFLEEASATEVSARWSCMFHLVWRSATTPNNNNLKKMIFNLLHWPHILLISHLHCLVPYFNEFFFISL